MHQGNEYRGFSGVFIIDFEHFLAHRESRCNYQNKFNKSKTYCVLTKVKL